MEQQPCQREASQAICDGIVCVDVLTHRNLNLRTQLGWLLGIHRDSIDGVILPPRFQKIDPKERDSYFQIAGIHGQPNVPWDEPIDAKLISNWEMSVVHYLVEC
jgi:hypothetical protein